MSRLVIDIGPLREKQFTGIPNVVKEVVTRALAIPAQELVIEYSVGDTLVEPAIVAATVDAASGELLQEALRAGTGVHPLPTSERNRSAGLNLHIKPPRRRFATEALFFHDLSFLSVPKLHQIENVCAHLSGFRQQIETTDIFFTNSNATKLDLGRYGGVAATDIHVTHLGHDIDPHAAAAVRARIAGQAEPFLLVLGTIEPRKNIAFLLRWLAINPAVLDDYRVVFCGREGWGQTFNELVEIAGLADALERARLKHVGFSNASQRLALLVSARALIFPSLYEGFGLPVLEAMACRTPVVASSSTSIPEVLGGDGFYFDPSDLQSLTDAFERFRSEDGALLNQRAQRLEKRSTQFSYDNMFQSMMNTIMRHQLAFE